MEEIIIGVASGVLSAWLLWVIYSLFQKVFVPWHRVLTYSGVDISGEWHCIDPKMAQEITLALTQKANIIEGLATFSWDHDDWGEGIREFETIRTFNIKGFVRDRFVQLTMHHTDAKRIGINSYLLEVCGDGRKMQGAFCFYSVKSNIIDTSMHLLFRDRTLAEQISGAAKQEHKKRRLELIEELKEAELEEISSTDYEHKK